MRQALIVDDSKTARLSLRKMLDRQHVAVTAVESAEEALEFLQNHHPDVIFMDHMMPGMDGFAAVKAIKANPDRSSIPIVMHTTKQGDIYIGQARALGAIDILCKPATDQDLKEVLDAVDINNNYSQANIPVAQVMPVSGIDSADDIASDFRPVQPTDNIATIPSLAAVTEADIQAADSEKATTFWGERRQWLFVLIWLAPILWLLTLYLSAQQQIEESRQQQAGLLSALEWAVGLQESYDYGELPLAGDRLVLLRGLVEQLELAGFSGTIRLESYVGEFCLVQVPLRNGRQMDMLPSPDLPMTACDLIGVANAMAFNQSIAQSEEFRTYVQSKGLFDRDATIRLELIPRGSNAQHNYPVDIDGVTTGDWNTVALKNNKVHFRIIPDA